jgi:acyl carrier protein
MVRSAAILPNYFWPFEEGDAVETITDGVRQIISSELKIPLERLTPDTVLQDVGVTSLDLIFIIFALEEKFDISIPYNANEVAAADKGASSKVGLGKLETIVQISAAVKGLMDAKTSK